MDGENNRKPYEQMDDLGKVRTNLHFHQKLNGPKGPPKKKGPRTKRGPVARVQSYDRFLTTQGLFGAWGP